MALATRIARFCQIIHTCAMSTMNISLPDALKSFVDEQVSQRAVTARAASTCAS